MVPQGRVQALLHDRDKVWIVGVDVLRFHNFQVQFLNADRLLGFTREIEREDDDLSRCGLMQRRQVMPKKE